MMTDFHEKMMATGIPLDILAEFLEITPKQMEDYCYGEAEPPPELMAKVSVLPIAEIVKAVAARKAAMTQSVKRFAARPVRLNPRFTGDLRIETERKRQAAKKRGKNGHAGR